MKSVHQRARVIGGGRAQDAVRFHLQSLGIIEIDELQTGWHIQRGEGGAIVGARPKEKVGGDFRAMLRGGRSVLVEAKKTEKPDLPYTRLEWHQRSRLQTHQRDGGVSILAWAMPGPWAMQVIALEWPLHPDVHWMERFPLRWSLMMQHALTSQRVGQLCGKLA